MNVLKDAVYAIGDMVRMVLVAWFLILFAGLVFIPPFMFMLWVGIRLFGG